ncbi:MAG: hypothetical protein AB2551_14940 [Candidatus Thiodiazotropha sp.]
MDQSIVVIALWAGIIFGSLLLGSVIFVYVRHREFGVGGSILTPFGVMLLGLSVWKTVDISVTADGGLEAKFRSIEAKAERAATDARQAAKSAIDAANSSLKAATDSFTVAGTKSFLMKINYLDYLKEWESAQSKKDKNCVKDFLGGNNKRIECQEIVRQYKVISRVVGKTGTGTLHLTFKDNDQSISGVASYFFPADIDPVWMNIEGASQPDGSIALTFHQPPREVKEGGETVIRPAISFNVLFNINTESNTYDGRLIHPYLQVNNMPLPVAKIVLSPI